MAFADLGPRRRSTFAGRPAYVGSANPLRPFVLIAASIADVLYFAGCRFQKGELHFIDLPSAAALLSQPSLVFQRLQVMAFPAAGAGFFVASMMALFLGTALTIQLLSRAEAKIRLSKERLILPRRVPL